MTTLLLTDSETTALIADLKAFASMTADTNLSAGIATFTLCGDVVFKALRKGAVGQSWIIRADRRLFTTSQLLKNTKMKSYYITTTGTTTAQIPSWGAAKKLAAAALKGGIYPVEIEQRTRIDGRSPHRRRHVLIESPDCDQSLVKTENRWECVDSFYSHIRPSISL